MLETLQYCVTPQRPSDSEQAWAPQGYLNRRLEPRCFVHTVILPGELLEVRTVAEGSSVDSNSQAWKPHDHWSSVERHLAFL